MKKFFTYIVCLLVLTLSTNSFAYSNHYRSHSHNHNSGLHWVLPLTAGIIIANSLIPNNTYYTPAVIQSYPEYDYNPPAPPVAAYQYQNYPNQYNAKIGMSFNSIPYNARSFLANNGITFYEFNGVFYQRNYYGQYIVVYPPY